MLLWVGTAAADDTGFHHQHVELDPKIIQRIEALEETVDKLNRIILQATECKWGCRIIDTSPVTCDCSWPVSIPGDSVWDLNAEEVEDE
jgi:hypothetical protein